MPDAASLSVDTQASKYVASVVYTTGVITATSSAAESAMAGGTITLTGTYATNGQVTWVCSGTIAAKYRPASCQG